jgi:hypothetical protein
VWALISRIQKPKSKAYKKEDKRLSKEHGQHKRFLRRIETDYRIS